MAKPKEIELHPGHWKLTTSGANGLISEVTEARKVTDRVVQLLKAQKIPVEHFEDNTSTNQRNNINYLVGQHNKDRNGLIVSIHFNASGGTQDRGIGTEVLYYDQKTLSAKLAKAISDASGLKNRGAKQRTDLGVLASTYEPAILIEVCFVNSREDIKLYKANFEKICNAIAKVLAEEIGYTYKMPQTTAPTKPTEGKDDIMANMLNGTARNELREALKKARTKGLIDAKIHTDEKIAGYNDSLLLSYFLTVQARLFQ